MSVYDEIEFEDLFFNADTKQFTYPCPCGDEFIISMQELLEGEDIAKCPSCTLQIRIIYEVEDVEELQLSEEASISVC